MKSMTIQGTKKINSKIKGFTLIELLVSFAIVGILITMVIINIANAKNKANDSKALAAMTIIQKNVAICYTEGGMANIKTYYDTGSGIPLTVGGQICNPSNSETFSDIDAMRLQGTGKKYWAYANRQASDLFGWSPASGRFRFGATASCNFAGQCAGGIRPLSQLPIIICENQGCKLETYNTPYSLY